MHRNNLDLYISKYSSKTTVWRGLKAILRDGQEALDELPRWERWFHIFWLLGPFFLLIERTPGDVWISITAIAFVLRSLIKKDSRWLKAFWVQAAFIFWFWCLISSALSTSPLYSLGEAFVWFRFPLFAIAVAYWLGRDSRITYAMLVSIAAGTVVMCGILTLELLIVGQQGDRLSWPYGDAVPGNYLSKAGLPVFILAVTLAVSCRGQLAWYSGILAFVSIIISVLTGERINFLIRACGGLIACVSWKPIWRRVIILIFGELLAIMTIFLAFPDTAERYTKQMYSGVTDFTSSPWLQSLNGGIHVAKDNLLFGIGTGNYRLLSFDLLADVPGTIPQNHPHNYYIQMLCENGIPGLVLGVIFIGSMIWACFKSGLKNRDNVFIATAWIIPFGLFWPIATTADFFGQWNNIFMWSAVAIAMTSNTISPSRKTT